MKTYYYNPENPYRQDPDVHLLYWGREDCAPGHAVGPMVRDMYKIHFIHSGTGIVQVGDHTYSLGPGQAFLIYPDVLTYYEADRQTPWVYSWLAFRGEQVESILARTRLSPGRPVFPMDVKVMPTMFEQPDARFHARAGNRFANQSVNVPLFCRSYGGLPAYSPGGLELEKAGCVYYAVHRIFACPL